jgi:Caspase domain/WD domain, G-beta repeat
MYTWGLQSWDLVSGSKLELVRLPDFHFGPDILVVSSEGRRLLSIPSTPGIGGIVRLLDPAGGKSVHELQLPRSGALAVSMDARFLATAQEENAIILDTATGREIRRFRASDSIQTLAFSPDGRLILAGAGNAAYLWDATSGNEIRHFGEAAKRPSDRRIGMIAFSPDGRLLLTGNRTAALLWDVASGLQMGSLDPQSSELSSAAFLPSGKTVVGASSDGGIHFWDVQSGNLLATAVSFGDGGWAVVTPDGRFDTNTLDGAAPLQWIVSDEPLRPLPLEIFMRDYYTPRLLPLILSGEGLPPLTSIAKLNRLQPKLEVLSVAAQSESSGRVTVTVKVSNVKENAKQSGAQDLRVFRNGQLVAFQEGPLALGQNGEVTLPFPNIQLPHNASDTSNKTIFTAYAFNVDRVKSQTVELVYQSARPLEPRPKNVFIIAIGVNKTPYSAWDLKFAAADARKIAGALEQRLKMTFPEVQVYSLISDEAKPDGASKQTIRRRLAEIATAATPDDALFISFSGHGYADPNGKFYLFPSDLKSGAEQRATPELLSSAISSDELAEWLRPVDAGEMTMIIDACHSAASVEGEGFKPGPMGSRKLGQLAYDKRIRILAATQVANAALESDQLKQGLLSYALVHDGLEQAQADWQPKDKRITVAEWLRFAVNQVPLLYEEIRTGRRKDAVVTQDAETKSASPLQLPALFDFTQDNVGLVLQQIQ